jgi:hypothetical protein
MNMRRILLLAAMLVIVPCIPELWAQDPKAPTTSHPLLETLTIKEQKGTKDWVYTLTYDGEPTVLTAMCYAPSVIFLVDRLEDAKAEPEMSMKRSGKKCLQITVKAQKGPAEPLLKSIVRVREKDTKYVTYDVTFSSEPDEKDMAKIAPFLNDTAVEDEIYKDVSEGKWSFQIKSMKTKKKEVIRYWYEPQRVDDA